MRRGVKPRLTRLRMPRVRRRVHADDREHRAENHPGPSSSGCGLDELNVCQSSVASHTSPKRESAQKSSYGL